MAKRKFKYAEINGTVYLKTEVEDFNIETYKMGVDYFNAFDPENYRPLRLVREDHDGYKLLAAGNLTDSLEALKYLHWVDIEI